MASDLPVGSDLDVNLQKRNQISPAAFLKAAKICAGLKNSSPQGSGLIQPPQGGFELTLVNWIRPERQVSPEPFLTLEVEQGSLRTQVLRDEIALRVETPTASVSSAGRSTFGVAYDPKTGRSLVSAYQGRLGIQPKNPALRAFALQSSERVEITPRAVGPLSSAPPPSVGLDSGARVPSADRLGRTWSEIESGYGRPAHWIRRGNSNVFDATWGGVRAVLSISMQGDQVRVTRRQSSDGNDCDYSGVLEADGVTVHGTYRCTRVPGTFTWRATIAR